MGNRTQARCYAWSLGGRQGIVPTWAECERIVSGKPARFRGFATRELAQAWLDDGARYEPKAAKAARKTVLRQDLPDDAIFFDAGTGRGLGTEINVTDRDGVPLLHLGDPDGPVTERGTIVLGRGRTNNYGELLACRYALRIARKLGRKVVLGDSALVVDWWSRGHMSAERRQADPAAALLVAETAVERRAFEAEGGRVAHVPGSVNPADLGFHRD